MRWSMVLPLAAVLAGCASQPESVYHVGAPVQSPFRAGGKVVPLPDGEWVVAASQRGYEAQAVEMVNLYLVNLRPQAEIFSIQISTNLAQYPWGWKALSTCSRKDMLFLQPNANYGTERQACWFVNHQIVARTSSSTNAAVAALDYAHAKGISLPPVSPYVGYRIADRTDYLTARFYFDPRAGGIKEAGDRSWIASAWHVDRVSQSPDRRAYGDKVIAWGKDWFPKMQEGFRGQDAR